nr:recombinase family protein [Sinirhodobacter huangdaonensis]
MAAAPNNEGIASPDSGKDIGTWGPSTISGNWKRGTGISNNELYIGRLVWNRQSFIKDPQSSKRQAHPNPPEEWIIEDVQTCASSPTTYGDRPRTGRGLSART